MSLVFVHGVSVREGSEYQAELKVRDGLFRKFALNGLVADPTNAIIENPYWGKYGAKFSWNHASLPSSEHETFGSEASVFEEIVAEIVSDIAAEPNRLLITITQKTSLVKAVDCIWAAAAYTKTETNFDDIADALSSLAVSAVNYAETNPQPEWLNGISDDDQFIEKLLDELDARSTNTESEIESFGIDQIWDHLKTVVNNLGNITVGAFAGGAVKAIRPWAHHRISLFIGDVLTYLSSRGNVDSPGEIVKEVSDAFQRAAEQKKQNLDHKLDDKLIIVAHSMGGNITYDILTHFLPSLECDLLLTVGSQVGMFEELKLFHESKKDIPSATQKKVPKPANIKRWINVFDPIDILGYATSEIFDGSEDYQFSTETSPLSAHSMYFYRPKFHQRLQNRIKQNQP